MCKPWPFDGVHAVRPYTERGGETTVFPTAQVNPHRKKRLVYGLSPRSTVRIGADSFCENLMVRLGAVSFWKQSYGAVGCDSVRIFCLFVRGGAVFFFRKPCRAVLQKKNAPNRTGTGGKTTVKKLCKSLVVNSLAATTVLRGSKQLKINTVRGSVHARFDESRPGKKMLTSFAIKLSKRAVSYTHLTLPTKA